MEGIVMEVYQQYRRNVDRAMYLEVIDNTISEPVDKNSFKHVVNDELKQFNSFIHNTNR